MRNAKGEGSAFKVGTSYRGYVTIDGQRKYFSAPSKAEAAQKKRELLVARDAGTVVAGKSFTLNAWMIQWLSAARLRPNVAAAYLHNIEHYISPTLGHIHLAKLMPEHIEDLYTAMLAGELSRETKVVTVVRGKSVETVVKLPLAPRTIGNVHANLRRALNVAVQRGHVARNVALLVEPPAKPKADTTAFSEDDTRKILASLADDRLAARWYLALMHGVRPAEALGITWPDIDLDAGTVSIHAQLVTVPKVGLQWHAVTKTEAGERELHLAPIVVERLRSYQATQQRERAQQGTEYVDWQYNGSVVPLVFTQVDGMPISTRLDFTYWSDMLVAAGIPHARRYQARHTTATLMAGMGEDATTIAATLGHSNSAMTQNLYIHPIKAKVAAAALAMGDFLAP